MSDDVKADLKEMGQNLVKVVLILLGFFASYIFVQINSNLHEMGEKVDKLNSTLNGLQNLVNGHDKDIDRHEREIEKLRDKENK